MKDSITVLQGHLVLKSTRNLPFHTRRDAWVEVNLAAIEENALLVKRNLAPGVDIMAVVKADAYGHGAAMIAPTLEASGIKMLGVASVDEALQLRSSGLVLPILVLSATPDWALHDAVENDIQVTIFTPEHLDSLVRLYDVTGKPTQIQIKVDTGMHRIGVSPDETRAFIQACLDSPAVALKGVYSHLSTATDLGLTATQQTRWETLLSQLENIPTAKMPNQKHLTNSTGTWLYPQDGNNMVRVGLSLLGYTEINENNSPAKALKPAMGVKARIVHLTKLPPGEGVSYGQTYINSGPEDRFIATLPLGYADGIPRRLSNQMDVLYQGFRVKQVGNITMDQLMIDVTDVPDARVGDVVTLIGQQGDQSIWFDIWAQALGTIEYELMCALRVRLPKVYVRN